jgi:hypothetical protein
MEHPVSEHKIAGLWALDWLPSPLSTDIEEIATYMRMAHLSVSADRSVRPRGRCLQWPR